jgi:hypothetical protein
VRRLFVALLTLLAAFQAGCVAGTHAGSSPSTPPPAPASVQVTVSPNAANVRTGNTQQFTATVTGAANTSVAWSVNGVAGGSAATGTIGSSGKYTAPASVPNPNPVTVRATSAADASVSATSAVTVQNPIPVLTGVNPTSLSVGSIALSVFGNNFVVGSQVLLGASTLSTTFVSSTQLTAAGSAPAAGTFAVTVNNPDPGASTSSGINVQVSAVTQTSACSSMSIGQGASLNGFRPFPANNAWNQDVSNAAIDPNSAAILNFIGLNVAVHPDFGAGFYQGNSIGIPYTVVGGQQAFVDVQFNAYGSESDPGPMPIPPNAPIEGYPNPGTGDRHVLVLDNNNCWLYELYSASINSDGTWNAGSAAVWDLLNTGQRPQTWTSADAAGLPIFPGLARYDEAASGQINHALRFTLQHSRAAIVPPASHWAANSTNALAAPMGMRLRLKNSFNISGFSAANQAILKALKQYGMIMADNGSSMYISGAPDDRWDNNDLHALSALHASDFEVIRMDTIYTASNLPQGSAPNITSFSASPAVPVAAGTAVTLTWNAPAASYFVISPQVGAVRGTSVSVTPTQTTTYTLYAANAFGRTTATVTVVVH